MIKNKAICLKHFCNVLLLVLAAFFSGCQKESEYIAPPSADKVVLPNSSLATLITNVTLHDGSYDNILDHTSCSSLVLPVTVSINSQLITINTVNDLLTAERILDESSTDDDTVVINFPVSAMMPDHTIVNVPNQSSLEKIMDECDIDSDDIECLDFLYPIKISVYDSNNQQPGILTISSDKELYELLKKLTDNYLAGFNFPVTMMTLADSSQVTVNNNDELEILIRNTADDCDEDDDNDHNDDDTDDTGLVTVLTSGVWKITSFVNETDQTAAYKDLSFTFNPNQTAVSNDGTNIINGSWESYGDNGLLELYLNFGEQHPFDEISDEWQVVDYSNTSIELKYVEEDDGSVKTLELKKV